jgi:hypothetical protein
MRSDFYGKLDADKNVVVLETLAEMRWPTTMKEILERRVGEDTIKGVRVSTVFLGMIHAFCIEDKDQWFETMVFGGEMSEHQERYATWAEALEGHARTVSKVQHLETMSTAKRISRRFSKLMKRLADL